MTTIGRAQAAVVLVLPVLFASAFASTPPTQGDTLPIQAPAPQTIPDQPAYWVAFSADLERIDDHGEVFSGRIYRAGDGSTRFETGAGPAPAAMTLIGIQNFTEKTSYRWNRYTGWSSGAIEVPPELWSPHPANESAYTPTQDTLEGFRLVTVSRPTSATWYAPALNMYPVKREIYNCGASGVTCHTRLLNIQLGEPPSTLFQPPAQ